MWLIYKSKKTMEQEKSGELAAEAAQPLDQSAVEAARSSYKDPFAGNVSKFTPLPPDCNDSKKKGLIEFDACFEGGENLVQPSNHYHKWAIIFSR